MTSTAPVLLITGASRGLGRALAEAALQRGDRVLAISRDATALQHLHGCVACVFTGSRRCRPLAW